MREPLPSDVEPSTAAPDAHVEAVRNEHRSELAEALAALPAQQREAVLLRDVRGFSYEEVAASLAVSTSAVESLLFRARSRLRSQLRTAYAAISGAGWIGPLRELLGTGGLAGAPVAAKAVAVGALGAAVAGGVVAPTVLEHRGPASPPPAHTVDRPDSTSPRPNPAGERPARRVLAGHAAAADGRGRLRGVRAGRPPAEEGERRPRGRRRRTPSAESQSGGDGCRERAAGRRHAGLPARQRGLGSARAVPGGANRGGARQVVVLVGAPGTDGDRRRARRAAVGPLRSRRRFRRSVGTASGQPSVQSDSSGSGDPAAVTARTAERRPARIAARRTNPCCGVAVSADLTQNATSRSGRGRLTPIGDLVDGRSPVPTPTPSRRCRARRRGGGDPGALRALRAPDLRLLLPPARLARGGRGRRPEHVPERVPGAPAGDRARGGVGVAVQDRRRTCASRAGGRRGGAGAWSRRPTSSSSRS